MAIQINLVPNLSVKGGQAIRERHCNGVSLIVRCNEIEKQIDEMVYETYGLTEEEIRIVEGK
jgi:hypothetical protein